MTISLQRRSLSLWLMLAACICLALPRELPSAITAEHQKQIAEIRKELTRIQGLIAKKEVDEAEQALNEAEKKLRQIAKDAEIDENHKLIAGLLKQIELKKGTLQKKHSGADGKGGGISFEKEVAPILVARCLTCHGETDPRADLRLNTFGGIVQGCGGKLVVPGNPNASMLVRRITASGNQRMPRGGDPLSADEIRRITAWIAGGAKFTGDNATPLADLASPTGGAPAGPVTINKPVGGERVSFVRDIAPFMTNLCLGCHSGNGQGARQTGFSIETFERLMRGGRGGPVVLPGNLKESRLWHLVGEQDPIKMPPGQALITRTNWNNLKAWIEEGAKFDGTDAQVRAPFRSLVPSAEEVRAKELAALTPEELEQRRKDRAAELWHAALRSETPIEQGSDEFLFVGNAAEARIAEIRGWAAEDVSTLRKTFSIKESPIWRGKLIVFVFKDRFSYAEFVLTNEKAEVPAEIKGHVRVNFAQDQVYLCLEDAGDTPADDFPGTRAMLLNLLTEAILKRTPGSIPDWAARGMGLTLAARHDPKNAYFKGLPGAAHEVVKDFAKPQDLLNNGAVSAADLPAVGYSLVTYMMKVGNEAQFVRFLGLLSSGKSLPESLKTIYGADPDSLARGYLGSLGSARPASKKPAKGK